MNAVTASAVPTATQRTIPTTVIRTARRTVAIQVCVDGVIVRAPYRVSDAEIERVLSEKKAWIDRHYAKITAACASASKMTADEVQRLAKQALDYIPKRAAYYADIMGVRYHKITIRSQRTKWGSCSSKGNLNFNCLLMLMPPEVIDSVVVHELCHLKEMNHSARFYAEIAKVYPEYDRYHAWLKEHGAAFIARMG